MIQLSYWFESRATASGVRYSAYSGVAEPQVRAATLCEDYKTAMTSSTETHDL